MTKDLACKAKKSARLCFRFRNLRASFANEAKTVALFSHYRDAVLRARHVADQHNLSRSTVRTMSQVLRAAECLIPLPRTEHWCSLYTSMIQNSFAQYNILLSFSQYNVSKFFSKFFLKPFMQHKKGKSVSICADLGWTWSMCTTICVTYSLMYV